MSRCNVCQSIIRSPTQVRNVRLLTLPTTQCENIIKLMFSVRISSMQFCWITALLNCSWWQFLLYKPTLILVLMHLTIVAIVKKTSIKQPNTNFEESTLSMWRWIKCYNLHIASRATAHLYSCRLYVY